jgi:hypothetical protein
MAAKPGGPTLRGFCSYTDGEIDNAAGDPARAEQHYTTAISLARESGTTFLAGIASVGMVTALASMGRTGDALRGFREVIDYWVSTGNWTHLWVTLRNLADLLRRLGDIEPAALIDAAADQAPDAPATGPSPDATPPRPAAPAPGRAQVLDVARRAIERHLDRS